MGRFAKNLEEKREKEAATTAPAGDAAAPARRSKDPSVPDKGLDSILSGEASEERKTKRVQLLVRPSDYARWADAALKHNLSVNELVNRVMNSHCGE